MKKAIVNKGVGSIRVMPIEGECIEEKVRRITQNNEPIEDGAPIIYTERKDGVNPAYDIRTDKWDIAQEAMQTVNDNKKQMIANRAAKNKGATEKDVNQAMKEVGLGEESKN